MLATALNQIVRAMNLSKGTVRSVGSFLAGLAIQQTIRFIKKRVRHPQRGEVTHEVPVTHVHSIHAYLGDDGGVVVNTDGEGYEIARIYQDDDGAYYKLYDNRWYQWNGSAWV